MSASDWAPELAHALAMADAADALALARYRATDLVVETKPDLTPVSDADRSVEHALRSYLADHFPTDAILGEEFGTAGDSHAREWIIDPIDGTKNFVRGVPVWATLIALRDSSLGVVVGVASAPALGRRWWASRGAGAFTIGPESPHPRRLRVSGVSQLADASLSFSDAQGWGPLQPKLDALRASTWRQRAYGDFWSHLLVAEGAVDIAVEPSLESYDVAALIPIVEEAGGRLTTFAMGAVDSGGSALSTNGILHNLVADVIRG